MGKGQATSHDNKSQDAKFCMKEHNLLVWHSKHHLLDNGKQFDNFGFQKFCKDLGVKNHYSSLRHPQANGQVEVTNKSLLKIIKTWLEGAKNTWPKSY